MLKIVPNDMNKLKYFFLVIYTTCFVFQVGDQVLKFIQGRTIMSYSNDGSKERVAFPTISICPGVKGNYLPDITNTDSSTLFSKYYPWNPSKRLWCLTKLLT